MVGDYMKQNEINYKTKLKLSNALKKLMCKKPVSKITITEIVEMCDVNRKTFYYHFIDIYDLLEWTLQEDAVSIIKSFDLMTNFDDAVRFAMDYVEKNHHIINCAIDSVSTNYIKNFFVNNFNDFIFKQIKKIIDEKSYNISDRFITFLTSTLTSMIAIALYDWMIHMDTMDKQLTINYVDVVIKHSLADIIAEANNKY